jgi:heme/copper-type cytochrome/quinol oxidase subunit 2
MTNKQLGFSYYEFGMYYQSIFKNIGIYLLIALTLIVHSRYYKDKKHKLLNIFFMILSVLFVLTTLLICIYCIIDYKELKKTAKNNLPNNHLLLLQKWKYIPYFIIIIILSVLLYLILNIYKVSMEK